ncbi:MAG: flagellar export chaperone FliS [Micromonosporaceae bacterium]|nr:flagellar export chaperone FliS [Micromonosporaceae bacterium]
MTRVAHDRYLRDAVMTASPGKLLVMLYERLVRDLTQGEEALRSGERSEGSRHLTHAQDIIIELRASLDLEGWDGAPRLASIYTFLLTELIAANVQADADRVASCRELVAPLLETWREALVLADEARTPAQAGRAHVA